MSGVGMGPQEETVRRVLVVDDDDASRSLLTGVLENWGYWVVEARSGGEALALLRRRDFRAMLTDLEMPVLDGFVLVRQVRGWEDHEGLPRLPVMAVSAHASLAARRECARLGFDCVLAKPFDWEAISASLQTMCGVGVPRQGHSLGTVGPEVRMLVPGFLAARRRELVWMETCLHERDFEQLTRFGHRLKGSGGSFGFPELSVIGARLGCIARLQDRTGCEALLVELAQRLHEASRAA